MKYIPLAITDLPTIVKGKRCPYYDRWRKMLNRCYNEDYLSRHPSYNGCKVSNEWLMFSNFKAWMEKQDWEGKHLDKDLLIQGNRLYSEETCLFIDGKVNTFMTESTSARGLWPIGVNLDQKKFKAQCKNPFTGKKETLGRFTCPNEAHQAWLKRKRELATLLAAEQTDERVAKAIIDRYMNYGGTND